MESPWAAPHWPLRRRDAHELIRNAYYTHQITRGRVYVPLPGSLRAMVGLDLAVSYLESHHWRFLCRKGMRSTLDTIFRVTAC